MESNVRFDYNAPRAAKARFNNKMGKILDLIAVLGMLIFGLLGIVLLVATEPFGWVVLSFIAWPLMLHLWLTQDLGKLPPIQNSYDLADILDVDLLGVLPQNPSPRDLATSVMKTNGGRFFAARFGVSAQYLPELSSSDPADTAAVWSEMVRIHDNLPNKGDTISAATLTAAIVRTQPSVAQTLSVLHIDADDMILGAEWFAHLSYLIQKHSKPRKTGGFARDWSFGYTPTLQQFGENLSQKFSGGGSLNNHLESHLDAVAQLFDTLGSHGRANAALIGPVGSGKTTIVDNFAEKLLNASEKVPDSLRFNQVFSLDAAALISAASARGQIEPLMNHLFNEAYKAKNIILFFNNAEMFFEDATGSLDISSILQPILEGGAIKVILALNEQKFLQIAQAKPALSAALNRIQVAPPDETDVKRILEDQIISIEVQRNVIFMYQALTEAYRLSERYINDVAQPQKSIQLLENSAGNAEGGLVTAQSVRSTIEKTLGIKVGGAISHGGGDLEERDKLLNLETLVHERMINQVNAVKAVSSALRRARAGVRNENRPIGTFLFLGPTGVGKTELAKTVAEVYFGGEGNMVRIDLNEYVRAEDVARLIADGATDTNSLSAQVQKNPFSVVLLDEIEKAHDSVLTTLLQVLDEGILRDINNREISFRDTIVIATSNAGADQIRAYIDQGLSIEEFADKIQTKLIEDREFKPEFLNRFDEIVMFRPLDKDELLQVVELTLRSINKNLALQKVSVVVDDEAKRALVEAGYDPRLGARPMRRVIQKTVENIVAQKLLTGELVAGTELPISLQDLQGQL